VKGNDRRGQVNSLETTLHEIDSVIDVTILIPLCVFFSCARNVAIDVRRVIDDDRRIQRLDESVEVRVRRSFEIGNVGNEGAVFETNSTVSFRRIRALNENRRLTVKGSASFHLSLAEDSGDLSKCFGIIVRVEERESSG